MLGLDYGESDDDESENEAADTFTAPSLSLPALAQQVASSDDDDDDDDDKDREHEEGQAEIKTTARQTAEDHEDGSSQLLPSIDDALGAVSVPDFLRTEAVGPSYGSVFDEPEAAPASASIVTEQPPPPQAYPGGAIVSDRPERSSESTRQKNARKEKLGQATFTLKWDRDCGAEKASGGLESSANLQSRTMPGSHRKPARGNADAASVKVRESGHREAGSMKDRTKLKRQRDQSASFLGGRWKSEQEMHMRDFFDS